SGYFFGAANSAFLPGSQDRTSLGRLRRSGGTSVATACVMQTRLRSPRADILLDAALYTGSARRKRAREGIDQSWLNHQHRELTWALTDSGYVADGDVEGLRTILTQSATAHDRAQARSKGVLAALPLAVSWLTNRADALVAALNRIGTPVAIMLEHERP